MVSFPDLRRSFGGPQAVRKRRPTPAASRAAPRMLQRTLRLSELICRPLALLPRPPIAAVVRGVARPAPARAASVVAIPIQSLGLRLPVFRAWLSHPVFPQLQDDSSRLTARFRRPLR